MSFLPRLRAWGELNRDDSPELSAYAQAMERGEPFIRVTLDVDQPIELTEFLGAFTSVAAEYDRYVRDANPEQRPNATMFVKEVRAGSTIADLIPYVVGAGGVTVIGGLAAANTVHEFVERYGGRISRYLRPGGRVPDATKGELQDFNEQVAAIASNPNSTLEIAAIQIDKGEERITAAFKFNTSEAREIQTRVEEHKRQIDHTSRSDRERVLMIFTRTDVGSAPVGKRSGERVVIEDISDQPRPLAYGSELAEQQIKHEIKDAEDNVYKKGFVVDVNIETRSGKPVAYSVTNLHQVIDLDDD